MDAVTKKQEEIVTQLQLAVELFLEKGELELATNYSELFKLNCEAYRALINSFEVKKEKIIPLFKFHDNQDSTNTQAQEKLTFKESKNKETENWFYIENKANGYQQEMEKQYKALSQPQEYVISQYSYGDGQENPKIRASDSNGKWGVNGEPNQVITPLQQSITLRQQIYNEDQGDIWEDDPRRNFKQ